DLRDLVQDALAPRDRRRRPQPLDHARDDLRSLRRGFPAPRVRKGLQDHPPAVDRSARSGNDDDEEGGRERRRRAGHRAPQVNGDARDRPLARELLLDLLRGAKAAALLDGFPHAIAETLIVEEDRERADDEDGRLRVGALDDLEEEVDGLVVTERRDREETRAPSLRIVRPLEPALEDRERLDA